jgi:SH3 domain-containing YSC84-like protein 1
MVRTLALALAVAVGFAAAPAYAASPEAEDIVAKSEITLKRVLRDQENGPRVRDLMKRAKGVMIFPNIIKGAFFIGGEGGSGVLMARYANDAWSYPAFYTMGSVSFGLQIGGQSSEAVLLVMTQNGVDAILNDQVKLGADLSAAAGPVGAGAEASTTTAGGADIYVYSLNQGLFVGASLEGAVVARRNDWNEGYYGKPVTPIGIVRENKAQNPDADPLRAQVEALN